MSLTETAAGAMRTLARRFALLGASWIGGWFPDNGGRVLTYHSIDGSGSPNSIHPRVFAWQMNYLKDNGYTCVSLGRYLDAREQNDGDQKRLIALTFDDGYKNFASQALPVLRRLGFAATVFVVAGRVGKTNAWEKMAGIPIKTLMGWDELHLSCDAGMEIGSHSVTHPHLSRLAPDTQRREIEGSKAILEAELGQVADFFCYPYGDYGDEVRKQVQMAGYRAAVTTRLGYDHHDSVYLLPRIGMNRVHPNDQAAQRLYLKLVVGGALRTYSRLKGTLETG